MSNVRLEQTVQWNVIPINADIFITIHTHTTRTLKRRLATSTLEKTTNRLIITNNRKISQLLVLE